MKKRRCFWMKGMDFICTGCWAMAVLLLLDACHSTPQQALSRETPTDTVWIRGLKFVPDTLYLSGESRVVFINQDMVVHNVKSLDSSWGSSNLPSDSSWSFLMQQSAAYQCTLHPTMRGWIIVQRADSKH